MSGDKLRSPHVSWVFAQLVTFPIFGRGATFGWPSPSPTGALSPAGSGDAAQWAAPITDRRGSGDRPLGNVPPGRSGPQGGSQVCAPPKACAKPSLASPFGGGGLALARTERASCQRPPRMGCVEALAGCPLSHGCRRASSPEGGAKLVHNQKFAESQVSPPPLGEVPPQGAERARCQRPLPKTIPVCLDLPPGRAV